MEDMSSEREESSPNDYSLGNSGKEFTSDDDIVIIALRVERVLMTLKMMKLKKISLASCQPF